MILLIVSNVIYKLIKWANRLIHQQCWNEIISNLDYICQQMLCKLIKWAIIANIVPVPLFLSVLWKSIYIFSCNLLLLRKSFALVKQWKKLQIRLVPAHFTCFVRNYFSVWKIIHLHINLLDIQCIFSNNDNDVVKNCNLFYFLLLTFSYLYH